MVFLFLSIFSASSNAAEVDLLDADGEYTAYIEERGIIYLWEGGEPPAYLEGESIYSFSGQHFGWFISGYITDHNGYIVGAIKENFKGSSVTKPFRGFKGFVPFKGYKQTAPAIPKIKNEWSNIPLKVFLKIGIASETGRSVSESSNIEELFLLQKVIKLKQIVNKSEYQECGLHKLTDAEITKLESVIATIVYALSKSTQQNNLLSVPSETFTSTSDIIESYIDGDFEGWDGDTIFKLDNGQIWQQDSYDYTYSYAYHPKVLIVKISGRYKMQVDGVKDTIYVRRLK